jgi:Sulfotransferase family
VIRHLLVIGAQRCGTTYLHTMLDAHQQITMARPANPEPKVFISDEATARGAEWYRETYFAHARDELLLGEKSTSYLEDPAAPERAAGMLGEIHVLAILRDPVKRAISNWRFSTENGLETRSLETALQENLAGSREWDPSRTSVSPFAYLERGRYVDYLVPWMSTFPETSHVLFLEELLEVGRLSDGLWTALGVAPELAPRDHDDAVNQSPGEPPGLTAELLGTLEAYFQKSNRALCAHLGRDLPW